MAFVAPFKAIRPAKDKASFVASKSYDEYSEEELEWNLKFNPFSFLHIINPGYKFNNQVRGKERLQLIRNRYLEFLEEDVFLQDNTPGFYLYQIQTTTYRCLGFFCATSVQDYDTNVIKKHEDTIQRREILFATYLKSVRFNAEPVLMTYPDDDAITEILETHTQLDPEYRFTSTDKIQHCLWKMENPSKIKLLQDAFSEVSSFYIADGHHRSASSSLLAKKLATKSENPSENAPYNFFMSYLIPESQLRIYGFNRMIRDLNGLSPQEFLIRLDAFYRIEKREESLYQPIKKHQFSMYLNGAFYSLFLRKTNYQFTDALSELDTQILYKTILEPLLGIHDLRDATRIAYDPDKTNLLQMKKKIDAGEFKVGFSLTPITMEEIKTIADANLVMPPKSTYIEPKLRSGLAIYEL